MLKMHSKAFLSGIVVASVFVVLFLFFSSASFAGEYAGKRISSIGISGNYPYIETKIRRYITVRPGDIYDLAVIEEQLARVKDFYAREGWHNTDVTMQPEYIPSTDSIALHVKIVRGFLLRYRNIEVTGNYSLPSSLVMSKINTWIPYKPRRLREAIRKIINVYRKRGYPLARVRVVEKEMDLENHKIDITVNIEEGPRVNVIFEGNEHLGGKVLKQVITIYREGAIDTFELEESVREIARRYTRRGFPEARVSFNKEEDAKGNITVTFNIEEGHPERVREISFTGEEGVSSVRLKNEIVTKSLSLVHRGIFDEKVLDNDLKRIKYYYRSRGYLDASTGSPRIEKVYDDTQLIIVIPVEEGRQINIRSINFDGITNFPVEKLQKQIRSKVDKPLNANILDSEQERLLMFYADNGYPYANVRLDVVRCSSGPEADLVFKIDPGSLVRFGDITIVGDFLTSQKAIKKAMSIREGELYSAKKITGSEMSLRRLGAFASADIDRVGFDERATVVPLVVKVEEMRPFRLDFEAGYSTDENFVGTIDFSNLNSFGWAKRSTLKLTGGRKFSRAEIGWIDPHLAGTELEMTIGGWLQYENKRVYKYMLGGGGVGIYRRYHRTSFLVRTELNRNYMLSGNTTAADEDSLRDNTISKTSLSLSFDTRNSFADPTRGVYVMGLSDFFNEIGGKHAHFVKLGIMGGFYLTAVGRFTLANDVRAEDIQTFGSNVSVPTNELLFLGGDDTLRGFSQNSLGPTNAQGKPTGGRFRFIQSTELRIGLFGNLKWIFFHDMGWLVNDFDEVSLDALRHSAGFGINYITPVGPIRIDYGFIVDRKPGEHVGRFHLIFGYIF